MVEKREFDNFFFTTFCWIEIENFLTDWNDKQPDRPWVLEQLFNSPNPQKAEIVIVTRIDSLKDYFMPFLAVLGRKG